MNNDKCQRCKSPRVATLSAKCSDMCGWSTDEFEHRGYAPEDVGVGGGDYIQLSYCLDCGQIQGEFPVKQEAVDSLRIGALKEEAEGIRYRLSKQSLSTEERAELRERFEEIEEQVWS